jgi:PAS domain S-box-containing protein
MQAGEFDVIDTIFRNEKREKLYDFSKAYATIPVSLFFHSDISGIRGPEDVKGFMVAAKSGDYVLEVLKKSGVTNIVEYQNYETIVAAARDGQVKVFTVDLPPAHYYLHKFGIHDQFRETAPMYSGEFHRAVAKGNKELLATVENGFARISANEYKGIDKQWMGSPVSSLLQLRFLWYAAAAVAAVGSAILVWLMILKRAVFRKTRELAESEERYRSIIENMQDVYYRSDAEGRLTMLSHSGVGLLGYDNTEQMLGQVIGETFYYEPDERDAFLHNLKMKGALYGYEVTLKRKDGASVPVATSTHLMFDPAGIFMGVEGVFRDITSQRSAEDALRNSEDKFSKAFSHAPLLMTISDIQTGTYLEANNRFCEVSGFNHSEVLGRTSIELGWITADERNRLLEILKRDGRVHDCELALTAKDGRPVFCLYSSELITIHGSERLLSIALDISERKKDLEKLTYTSECFRQALNSPLHILYRLNVKKGCYDYLSPVAEQTLGHPLAQLMQTSLEKLPDYFHPEDRERIFTFLEEKRAARTGNSFNQDIEYRFRKGDGSYCWLHDSNTACLDDQGEFECFFGTAHDITARKQTEALLRESEERYRQLVEQSTAWIWEADAGFWHRYSNENVERILGYSPEEFCAQESMLLVHPDDHEVLRKTLEESIARRTGWNGVVLRWLTRDGSWRSIESSGMPVFNDEGKCTGLQGVDTDITDRLQLHQEREKGQRLESLGLLAGGIAHDFNNILTGIVGNLSLARMMLDNEHRSAGRLEECEKAAKRASELTQQLLTFARGGEPVKKVVDVSRLINEAVSFGLRGSKVKGVLEIVDNLWLVDADEGQIIQVFNNLLINAAQAMPEGGTVTIRAENMVAEEPSADLTCFVRLTIRDTGVGIPQDIIAKVFDPYFTTKQEGSGLGLASVYSIVTRHRGSVNVSSEAGAGTEFVICLPATVELSPLEQVDTIAPHSESFIAERVLVMDDEHMITEVVSLMLSELGCTVDTCSDGAEAVTRYHSALENGKPYHITILDLTVPGGVGGLEAARRIIAIDPQASLIVSSGYSQDAVLADFREHGFSGVVMKPFSMDLLIEEVTRVMKARRCSTSM